MNNINNVNKLTRASMLLVIALVITFIGARFGGATFNSIVVGPLINAVILTAVLMTDLKFGILVAFSTPILAALTGQLAAPMVPFAPFIMVGNVIYAVAFGLAHKYVKAWGSYLGIGLGAVLKAGFLIFSVKYLVALFNVSLPEKVLAKLSVMMSYPQAITAVAGGIIALGMSKILEKAYASKGQAA